MGAKHPAFLDKSPSVLGLSFLDIFLMIFSIMFVISIGMHSLWGVGMGGIISLLKKSVDKYGEGILAKSKCVNVSWRKEIEEIRRK